MESTYDLYFTGKDDARDGLIVIGEDTKPIFFMFETPNFYMVETRTTVRAASSTPLSITLTNGPGLQEQWRGGRLA